MNCSWLLAGWTTTSAAFSSRQRNTTEEVLDKLPQSSLVAGIVYMAVQTTATTAARPQKQLPNTPNNNLVGCLVQLDTLSRGSLVNIADTVKVRSHRRRSARHHNAAHRMWSNLYSRRVL